MQQNVVQAGIIVVASIIFLLVSRPDPQSLAHDAGVLATIGSLSSLVFSILNEYQTHIAVERLVMSRNERFMISEKAEVLPSSLPSVLLTWSLATLIAGLLLLVFAMLRPRPTSPNKNRGKSEAQGKQPQTQEPWTFKRLFT